jgi:hypothetical protein
MLPLRYSIFLKSLSISLCYCRVTGMLLKITDPPGKRRTYQSDWSADIRKNTSSMFKKFSKMIISGALFALSNANSNWWTTPILEHITELCLFCGCNCVYLTIQNHNRIDSIMANILRLQKREKHSKTSVNLWARWVEPWSGPPGPWRRNSNVELVLCRMGNSAWMHACSEGWWWFLLII